jgi:hypothetical protein
MTGSSIDTGVLMVRIIENSDQFKSADLFDFKVRISSHCQHKSLICKEKMNAVTDIKKHPLVSSLMAFYEDFAADKLSALEDIYTQDIEFLDPIHKVTGILSLKRYMKQMATNLTHYKIRYVDVVMSENSAYLTWDMEFANPKLAGGKVISLRGVTNLKFTNRVYYHEDVYDLGAMVYEHLPVIGKIIRSIKIRMGDSVS